MKRLLENFSLAAGATVLAAVFTAHAGEFPAKPATKPVHVTQEKNPRAVASPRSLSFSGLNEFDGYGSLYIPPADASNGYMLAPHIGRNLGTVALTFVFSGLAAKSAGNDHGIAQRLNNNNSGLIMSADGVAAQVPLITNTHPGKANVGVKFSSDRLSGLGLGLQMEWHW